MAKTQFLDYTIYLTDAALVQELQATPHAGAAGSGAEAGGAVGRIIMAPSVAATTYSAPIQEESTPMVAPCIRSSWFTTGNNFPRDQRTFDRCNGGWFGICFLFGTTTHFYWRGQFAWVPKIDATVAPTGGVKVAMALRRYIDGAEMPNNGDGGSGNLGDTATRAASRSLQGYGYQADNALLERVHVINEAPGGTTQSKGWDRFYIRIRRYPTAKQLIWRTSGSSSLAGVYFSMNPGGQIVIDNIDNAGSVVSTVATIPTAIPLNVWKKLDIIWAYNSTVKLTAPFCSLYINGVNVAELAGVWGTSGLGQDQLAANCRMGTGVNSHNGIAIQYDDWIGSEWPTGTSLTPSSVGVFPGLDWNNGSNVRLVKAKAFGSDNAASWAAAGDWRVITQRKPIVVPTASLQNTTSGARLTVLVDADKEVDGEPGQLGIASMIIGMFGFEAGGVNGNLGYRLPGASAVLASVTQNNANYQWRNAYYTPSQIDPVHPTAGLEIIYEHGVSGAAQNVAFLGAAVEVLGQFGPEDMVPNSENDHLAAPPPTITATQTASYVAAVKADLQGRGISLTGDCGAFEITKRVAWGLRDAGAGCQIKTSGANCGGKAVAIIMFPTGRAVDILGDAGGTNTPQWNEIAALPTTLYALPTDPGDAGDLRGVREHVGLHNAPYPHSPWATRGTPPFSPVGIVTGTYVGNGTSAASFKELTFRFPVHFLFIRNVTTGGTGIYWFSSMQSTHIDGGRASATALVDALIDPAFPASPPAVDVQEQQTIVRIVGNSASSNTNGSTYQYTAFCDPAQRFAAAGALHVHAGATDFVTTLDNEAFTPDALFLMQEELAGGATVGLHYRGVGHASGNCSALNAAEIAGASYARGTITGKNALHSAGFQQIAYIAFRKADGNNDAGQSRVLATTSYTGDGTASRTVGLVMGGRRPAWALVVPHNAASILRDVSHTGTNSLQFPSTNNAATGITGGGIDQISVGSALNSNGIIYDVFVFPGDTTAGNAGFSINGEFIPVAPDSPVGGDLFGGGLWDATPPDPELNPNEPGAGGGGTAPTLPDGVTGTDFSTGCVEATTFIINQALSHIGVSKQIGDITTEDSEEAVTARLHYIDDISAVLRAHPWQFATRYARLVLVGGTATVPVNGDWQYSYRAPTDMMFARRIVNPNLVGRGWDENPPKWRLGSDDTGLLIYSNETPTSGQPGNVTPELEYTIRTSCAALQGDSIFREALAWRHAFSLAPALAKDDKKAAFCLQVYQAIKATAETVGSREVQQEHEGDVDWIAGRE
jgi:hypothetical protein